jgi:hypothetical protein
MAQSALCRAITGKKYNVNYYFSIITTWMGTNHHCYKRLYFLLKINKNNRQKGTCAVFHKLVVAKTISQVFNSPAHSGA